MKKKIKLAFIYGSVARGKETRASDLDFFVVGHVGLKDLANILADLSMRLGREINPVIYSQKEFETKLSHENTFITEVIKSKKIWIIGNESEFEKMVKRRPASRA